MIKDIIDKYIRTPIDPDAAMARRDFLQFSAIMAAVCAPPVLGLTLGTRVGFTDHPTIDSAVDKMTIIDVSPVMDSAPLGLSIAGGADGYSVDVLDVLVARDTMIPISARLIDSTYTSDKSKVSHIVNSYCKTYSAYKRTPIAGTVTIDRTDRTGKLYFMDASRSDYKISIPDSLKKDYPIFVHPDVFMKMIHSPADYS